MQCPENPAEAPVVHQCSKAECPLMAQSGPKVLSKLGSIQKSPRHKMWTKWRNEVLLPPLAGMVIALPVMWIRHPERSPIVIATWVFGTGTISFFVLLIIFLWNAKRRG